MKIAIPTNDGVRISAHFGRSKAFKIIEIEDGKVINQDLKPNNFTGHAQGQHHNHDHNHDDHEHQAHSHAGIFAALGNCKTVIAKGMGKRLFDEFEAAQMEIFITKEDLVENAVQAYINQTLDNNPDACCTH